MEFKHLQSFEAVVRLNSFSRAAQELFISQPTISLHIHQLEEDLHTRLLIRTTKSIEVTPKGAEVYEYAVNILSLRNRMIENCSIESRRIVNIGASTIPSAYILPEVLPSYVKVNPETYFVIDQSDSEGIIEKLMDGLVDIGFVGMDPQNEEITAVPFYTDSVVLITPVNEHFLELKERKTTPLAELLKEPIILREEGSGSQKAADLFLQHAGVEEKDLNVTARMNDPEAIKNMVAGGLGISPISEKAARNYRDENRILTFEFPDPGCTRQLYVAYRTNFILKSYAKDFLKYVLMFYRTNS